MPTASNRTNRTSNPWNSGRGRTSGSSNATSWSSRSKSSHNPKCAPGYQSTWNQLNQKASAFKTLANQTCGTAKCKRPSTATLNTFANWINKGANIQCATGSQITKWASTSNRNFKPTSAAVVKNALCNRFGKSTIKAVCCDKTGKWLIATAASSKGKPFCFPG